MGQYYKYRNFVTKHAIMYSGFFLLEMCGHNMFTAMYVTHPKTICARGYILTFYYCVVYVIILNHSHYIHIHMYNGYRYVYPISDLLNILIGYPGSHTTRD